MERDISGRRIILGNGTVTEVLPTQKNGTAYLVEMNIAGRQVWGHSIQPLHPGQSIWVRYCVGKSGTLYALTFGPR